MKTAVTLFISLAISLTFVGCNSSKSKSISNSAHQQVNNTRAFPRPANNVVCHNCRSAFKISTQMHKQANGHNYIECPVCHHDYSKKAQQ